MCEAFDVKYKVIDDFKGVISSDFLGENLEKYRPSIKQIYGEHFEKKDVYDPMLPHEGNPKCLKSVGLTKSSDDVKF